MPLSPTARGQFYQDLGKALPRAGAFATHEQRQVTAVEAFDALQPADAWEATLAVQAILASAQAVDCLYEAGLHPDDAAKIARCRAQFASLMREARAARRMLLQEQKLRQRVELAAGAPGAPLPPAEPAPTEAEAAPAAPAVTSCPKRHNPVTATQPSPDALAAARTFMRQHREAAARIRADHGITQKCRARWAAVLPDDPAVIAALIETPRKDLLGLKATDDAPWQAAA